MRTVTNKYGVEMDFEAVMAQMDLDIMYYLDSNKEYDPDIDQTYFDDYCVEHKKKWGEEFMPNKVKIRCGRCKVEW